MCREPNPQRDLLEADPFFFHVIAINWDELEPEQIVWLHNQRGQAENFIKELKIWFGMEQMPRGKHRANLLFLAIGDLAYNTILAQKRLFMAKSWWQVIIGTQRWRPIQQMILKLVTSEEMLQTLTQIHACCPEFG